ncbi:efflux RND transporter periplasmic adaptor subunit [Zavarzinella formosa]|uniref:efflux RND transporter periplasmic adaptor subunit n=1 Tax=Zavarzinella formosa TaxID=360055 RepID=UPI0002E5B5AF|nr:efflux RND transporter periplasmic adaptor subunit [Zavarzinella formosa]
MRLIMLLVVSAGLSVSPLSADPPKTDQTQVLDLIGRMEANTVRIRPLVSGPLVRILAADGASVKTGDLLAEIDPRQYQVDLDRAQALILHAQAKTRLATVTLERAKALSARGGISKEESVEAEAAAEVANAELAVAKADRERAAIILSRTRIQSPMDGRVGRFSVTVGDIVTTEAKEPITTVVATNRLTAVFELDERSLLRLRRAGLAGPGKMAVTLGLVDEEGFPHPAELMMIESEVNPKTGAVRCHASCANPDGLISPGMSVRVRLTMPEKK